MSDEYTTSEPQGHIISGLNDLKGDYDYKKNGRPLSEAGRPICPRGCGGHLAIVGLITSDMSYAADTDRNRNTETFQCLGCYHMFRRSWAWEDFEL
jgi:hypothetical protein